MFEISNLADDRKRGTTVWGYLVIVSSFILIMGIRHKSVLADPKSPFNILHIVLFLFVLLLLGILVITCINLINVQTESSATSDPILPIAAAFSALDDRILNLETAKSSLKILLVFTPCFWLVSMVVNYYLGIRRVREISRTEINLRLDGYDKNFIEEISNKTASFDQRVSKTDSWLQQMDEKIRTRINDIQNSYQQAINELNFSYQKVKKDLVRETKKLIKKMKTEVRFLTGDKKSSLKTWFPVLIMIIGIQSIRIVNAGTTSFTYQQSESTEIKVKSAEKNPSLVQKLDSETFLLLDKRIAVLESTKQELEVWINIFLSIVTILVALNIGLSVWQVGSIARKEIDSSVKEFDEKFSGILTRGTRIIDDKLSSYESTIERLNTQATDLDKKLEENSKLTIDNIRSFKEQHNESLGNFRTETQSIKDSIQSDLKEL